MVGDVRELVIAATNYVKQVLLTSGGSWRFCPSIFMAHGVRRWRRWLAYHILMPEAAAFFFDRIEGWVRSRWPGHGGNQVRLPVSEIEDFSSPATSF